MSMSVSIGMIAGEYLASNPAIGNPIIGAGIGGYAGAKAGHYVAERAGVSDDNNHVGMIGGIIGGAIGGGIGGGVTTCLPGGVVGSLGGAVIGGVIGHQVDKGRL